MTYVMLAAGILILTAVLIGLLGLWLRVEHAERQIGQRIDQIMHRLDQMSEERAVDRIMRGGDGTEPPGRGQRRYLRPLTVVLPLAALLLIWTRSRPVQAITIALAAIGTAVLAFAVSTQPSRSDRPQAQPPAVTNSAPSTAVPRRRRAPAPSATAESASLPEAAGPASSRSGGRAAGDGQTPMITPRHGAETSASAPAEPGRPGQPCLLALDLPPLLGLCLG